MTKKKTYNKMNDETLVILYSKGDTKAFDTLLIRHRDKVYSYIYYLAGCQELAEDIFQETFIKVLITIQQGRYNECGKFASWLYRIAHNLVMDYLRHHKIEKHVSCDNPESNVLNNAKLSVETIEHEIIYRQILHDVHRLVTFLPDEQREVVDMRFYRNLTFKEIAEITGVSINTSLGRMRYAVKNMRRLVRQNRMLLTTD